jgi:hypothetical protein
MTAEMLNVQRSTLNVERQTSAGDSFCGVMDREATKPL